MLEIVFGSASAARVLLYLQNYGEGCAPAIASAFRINVRQVRSHLRRFERGGLLVSRRSGRTRKYLWNRENPLATDVRRLLQTALALIPEAEYRTTFRERARPRRAEKPAA
jgi:predicted ArsR family transcriptional regulator